MKIALTKELIVQGIGEELLIFNPIKNTAHQMQGEVMSVFRALESPKTLDELTVTFDGVVNGERLEEILAEFEELGFLQSIPLTLSRRRFLKSTAVVGSILTVAAPLPSAAMSSATCSSLPAVPGCDCYMPCTPPSGLCGSGQRVCVQSGGCVTTDTGGAAVGTICDSLCGAAGCRFYICVPSSSNCPEDYPGCGNVC